MPQATNGQEFSASIYSYSATATLDQAHQFYASKAGSLGFSNPSVTSIVGSGSTASHQVTYYSYHLTIVLTSYDNDTPHVIVVISKVP